MNESKIAFDVFQGNKPSLRDLLVFCSLFDAYVLCFDFLIIIYWIGYALKIITQFFNEKNQVGT